MQQGQRFAINVEGPSRGYMLEVFNGHFQLPNLGPIGKTGRETGCECGVSVNSEGGSEWIRKQCV